MVECQPLTLSIAVTKCPARNKLQEEKFILAHNLSRVREAAVAVPCQQAASCWWDHGTAAGSHLGRENGKQAEV